MKFGIHLALHSDAHVVREEGCLVFSFFLNLPAVITAPDVQLALETAVGMIASQSGGG